MAGVCLYANNSDRDEHCLAMHRLTEELCIPEEKYEAFTRRSSAGSGMERR
jgi:hypothetical protein